MDLSKYIGREYEKYNCLDLVKEFYSDQFNLCIKNYFEGDVVPDRKEIDCLIKTNKGEFTEIVAMPKFGDIVVINLYGYASHLGVYVGNGQFLHSLKRVGSCLDNISRYSKMIEGFYRHQENASD